MTQTATKISNYEADFQAVRSHRAANDPAWLAELGDQAWSKFTELGFPTTRRGNERWKYTNVAPIAKAVFSLGGDSTGEESQEPDLRRSAPWKYDWINLVFIDGRFSSALSNLNSLSNPNDGNAGNGKNVETP